MTTSMSVRSRLVLGAAIALGLAACSGGGDGAADRTGTLTVGLTDAPVDVADKVVVQFTGVELKPKNGPAFSIEFTTDGVPTPKSIDVLALQSGERADLLDGVEVPAGEYTWMRLDIDAEPNVVDSYLELGGGQCELSVPSGDETGLKMIRGFTVGVGSTTDLTIDFDLRKSIVQPPGQGAEATTCGGQAYLLKPVLRLVDMLEVGTITGSIVSLPAGCESGTAPYPGNVYLFGPYADTPPEIDDFDAVDSDGADALASARVDEATFSYTMAFVPAGKYVVAYTCSADDVTVDADTDSGTPDEEVTFLPGTGSVTEVAAGGVATVDFTAVP